MDPHIRSMPVPSLAQQITDDIKAGFRPAVVVASVGSSGVTAFDPVAEIAEIAEIATQHGMWLHLEALWQSIQQQVQQGAE